MSHKGRSKEKKVSALEMKVLDAKVDVWVGMRRVFVDRIENLHAANQALRAIGAFLNDLLDGSSTSIRERGVL